MLMELSPAATLQGDRWTAPDSAKAKALMQTVDRLNANQAPPAGQELIFPFYVMQRMRIIVKVDGAYYVGTSADRTKPSVPIEALSRSVVDAFVTHIDRFALCRVRGQLF